MAFFVHVASAPSFGRRISEGYERLHRLAESSSPAQSSILAVGIQNMIRSFSFSRRNFLTRALATCATLASRRSLSKMVAVPSAFSTAPARYLKVADALFFCGAGHVTIGGWLGNKIDLCIGNRV